jgi:hypothetical protein
MGLFNFRKHKAEEAPLQQERPIEPIQLSNYHTCIVCGKESAVMYEIKGVGWMCKKDKDEYRAKNRGD